MCGLESRIKLLLTSESAAIYHLEGSLDRVSLRDQFSQFPPVILAGARGGGSCVTLTRVTGGPPPSHCVLYSCNSCSVHLYISDESRQHLIMTQVSSTEYRVQRTLAWPRTLSISLGSVVCKISKGGLSLDSKENRATHDPGPGITWDWLAAEPALDYCREKDSDLKTVAWTWEIQKECLIRTKSFSLYLNLKSSI